ncbi:ABC transporter ATP-binding protein/permease [Clostridium sp. SYSU_GA19001]|uniref:ABC transporter ATP-binding protein n=1 Tax=Clostridium caldaquaticum TaxID=2940653 RepID=UPI00207791D7|nr:ABC transporter ATP-binding protein [Clostridium caldaquaticum]MCM8711778.1 ABC transporter ATP-binding protein/permease [Clostridium caldaquaticum]
MFKLFKYMKGPAVIFALISPFMMLIEVTMDLMQPKLLSDIIDIGVAKRDISFIFFTGIKMISAALFGFIGGAGCAVFSSAASMNMGEKLRQTLFDKIQTLSFADIDKFKTSSIITRLTNDVTQVQNMIIMALRGAIRAPFLCLGGIVMAASLSKNLSIIFLAAVPMVLIAVIIVLKKSFPLFSALQEKIDAVNTVMRESILGIRVIKVFTLEDKQREKFDGVNYDLTNSSIQAQNMNMILWPIVTLIMNISVIAVLWFGGNMVNNGTLQIGKIMAFINYLLQIMHSLILFVMIVLNFTRAKASANRINEILDCVPSIQNLEDSKEVNSFDIEFKNVSFKYNAHSDNVLTDISVKINQGENVGIIGTTGSGKSSLVSLIPRLYDVTEGQVLIGGIDVKNISLKQLRENIGVVLQDSILFSGTIEENIMFGNEHADFQTMEAVSIDAQAYEFIMEKENGYKSIVEQRGKNLSGGQKQRINIARTLIRNPRILILDDSTSALDMATEAKVQNSINKRMVQSTVIIIAQRISAVMNADKIIVMDKGRICHVGTHKDLLNNCEIYKSIAAAQLGEEAAVNG